MGTGDHNAGGSSGDGLTSHPGGSSNIPSRFMLQKPELSADLMGHLTHQQTSLRAGSLWEWGVGWGVVESSTLSPCPLRELVRRLSTDLTFFTIYSVHLKGTMEPSSAKGLQKLVCYIGDSLYIENPVILKFVKNNQTVRYCKSSIKPQRACLILGLKRGGAYSRRGRAYLKE